MNTSLRVAMLTYSFYESDGRVRRYAETLTRRGDLVDVISLRRGGQANYNELNGVRIYRIQERVRDEKGIRDYLVRIIKFFFRSATLLTRKHLKKPYDLVHVHSVPDFEVFAALIPKLLGARIILDIHDLVPELYCNKFKINTGSTIFKLLVAVEKISTAFSDHTIISNDLWRNTLIARSVGVEKCSSILNYPDRHIFQAIGATRKRNEKTILLYPGTLNYHQGLDIAIKAFARIKNMVPEAEFHIYGDGPARASLSQIVKDQRLQDRVLLNDPVSLDEIVEIMANSDIGVIPKRDDGFGGGAFSTKSLEFMSVGVPIIVARTKIDQYYFNDSVVKFFEPGKEDDLAIAMLEMIKNKEFRKRLSENASKFVLSFSWNIRKQLYLNLVNQLIINN
jgi:glycosyltransferase involved in cell wall biosynthesis